MRVTRLEVFGFKSFLEKLALPLESGLTAVVGPNGCGKSNIVDALRWVLGETRASQLRGSALEDVIFNGTDTLRPLGLAEVTLTLRATSQDFFSEILTPLLKRKTLGSLAVVEQSDKSLIDEAPEEQSGDIVKRPVLTVVSGSRSEDSELNETSGFVSGQGEVDKFEAEADHELTPREIKQALRTEIELDDYQEEGAQPDDQYLQQLMGRYSWLKQVQEVQITRRLYRSGESEFFINRVACRLRDLKELFRLVGLGAKSHTIVAQGEVGRIISARPEERRLIIEEAAGVAGFRDKIASASRRLDETAQNLLRLDDVIKEVTRQVNSLRVQAGRAKNRQQLKDRIAELERQLLRDDWCGLEARRAEVSSKLVAIKAEEEKFSAELQRVSAEEQSGRADALALDVELDSMRSKIDGAQEELRLRQQRRLEISQRAASWEAKIGVLKQEISSIEERVGTLQVRAREGQEELHRLSQRDAELGSQSRAIEGNHDQIVRDISRELAQKREGLKVHEGRIRAARDVVVSLESRLAALKEQIAAKSPVNQIRDSLLKGKGGQSEVVERLREFLNHLSANSRLLGETLRVDPDYVRAVHAVLGERASFLLVDNALDRAKEYNAIIAEFSSAQPAAQTAVVLGMLSQMPVLNSKGTQDSKETSLIPLKPIRDYVAVDQEAEGLVNWIFKDVFVCDSLAEGIKVVTDSLTSDRASSMNSLACVTRDGVVLTPWSVSGATDDRGVVTIKRELDSKQLELQTAQESYDQISLDRQRLQAEVSECEQRHAEALAESQRRQVEARELANQQGEVRGRLEAERRLVQQVNNDLAQLSHNSLVKQDQLKEVCERLLSLKSQDQGQDQSDQEAERVLLESLSEWRITAQDLELETQESRTVLSNLSTAVGQVRREKERVQQEINQLDLQRERVQLEAANLHERGQAELGPDAWASFIAESSVENAEVSYLPQEQKVAFRDEVTKLRARIVREGEVDSTSIERFDEEQRRLQELSSQKGDLESAEKTLRLTIERLRKTSEERFVATFKAVSKNFSQLIPRLFGGGSGSLDLTLPDQPLESGVDIGVRPPGKKLKSIELMSGGEKALCAIALIVSMFLERPSPLCVLDEVDAPLDEANLVRFLSLVKEMSSKTQFMMITHNKNTMSVADRLIGVTMQQPGASRVVTVSLQEAYQQVA